MGVREEIFNSLLDDAKALSISLKYRDYLTFQHSERVKTLSLELGLACGLNQLDLDTLCIAAMFHDIGKIGIPDDILMKSEKFDETEWEIMQQHSAIGEEIMTSMNVGNSQEVARLIRHHHESYDGSGYPDHLSGNYIPLGSRIISIADSYDAISVTRVYHHARTHQETMAIMHEETGKKFDPNLMQLFCNLIELSPFKAARKLESHA
ncbi:HD-GYP domain-containing protein [Aliamphritea ceti]|uniref:HD-GYP domain-containing protein n=1 Tax=Aliamphritea ceti TaxID=1524258 RepID=UPI0021C492C1|nr:HD domain-containing phosphohydrolase [Aliamphritea ceti]